jgi:mannose-6-phosphate isomerase
MGELTPLVFKPVFKDKIWGGQKIRTVLGKDFSPLPNCGEMWVLSGVEGSQTEVAHGFLAGNELNELVEVYMGDLVGEKIYQKFGNEFPILVKFIDANDWLSIQVHPGDDLAMKRHGSSGKTEMWYILDAEKDSQIICGFSKEVSKEGYKDHLRSKTLQSILNFEHVKKGDVYYMPSGRVHALGPGILLAEIQQTSDVTYRIYDWDRIDHAGMSRELHIEEALDAIDFEVHEKYRSDYPDKPDQSVKVVESPYFTTNLISLTKPLSKDYSGLDSFVIYVCVEGRSQIVAGAFSETLSAGETLLIPAVTENVKIDPLTDCRILEVYMKLQ